MFRSSKRPPGRRIRPRMEIGVADVTTRGQDRGRGQHPRRGLPPLQLPIPRQKEFYSDSIIPKRITMELGSGLAHVPVMIIISTSPRATAGTATIRGRVTSNRGETHRAT